MATDVNETFAWVRISLTPQDLFHSWQSIPQALQASGSATTKPGLLAQRPISQGKKYFRGCKSFEEVSGFSDPLLAFDLFKVRNVPLMNVESVERRRRMVYFGSHSNKPAETCQYSDPFPAACPR